MQSDPYIEFTAWFEQARANEPSDHDAVALASVGANGRPSVRIVLMRSFDRKGFVYYTNLGSRKAQDFAHSPQASMCFHWKSTAREIRIEGHLVHVSDAEADAYFQSRPRESQIGAWASKQSQVLDSRARLEQRVAEFTARFGDAPIDRPPFWSGFRLVPDMFEFWDKRPHRLHARTLYTCADESWDISTLYP